MTRTARFLWRFTWANWLTLLIFAGVVFLGSAVTGVPEGTRNMFSIYLGIFPMMVPMILLLFNLGRCSTFLQLALSFGGQRRNYFLVIQLFLLFDTLLGYGVLLLLRDIPVTLLWVQVDELGLLLRNALDWAGWRFPLMIFSQAVMGCVVGLCLVRSKVLGSILTVLAIFSSLVGLMSLVLLGLLQNPLWIRLLLTAQPMGNVQVSGQDLSGVTLRAPTGELVVGGGADVTVQGTGQGEQVVLLTGSGRTALQHVNLSTLTVDSGTARIFVLEQSILKEVRLGEGAVLTISGGALAKIGSLHAGGSSLLRLTEGAAVALGRTEGAPEGDSREVLTVPVVVDGPVSLAAQAAHVRDTAGNRLEPFDLIWKTLLPGWSAITALEMDGRQVKMNLLNGEPVRLWLVRGDHGAPIHSLVVQGKDESGQPRTRYAYLHWNQNTQAFEEISMYPNPFSVTGGEPGRDWVYEEESQTLHILSSQVSAISGGPGTDAAQAPFSGRIVLADGIGPMELALGGVVCRVSSGRAFSLGQGNEVTLILQSGTSNLFESGTGCAGISLGSGTSLNIDCADPHSGGDPDGVLTATGGAGGAGIGWDGEGGWDQAGQILIRGGVSVGAGGFMGSVTIIGGIIVSSDGRGGGEGGLSLQMGEDTVALPQFRLSSRILQLEGLSVATREQALAAQTALEADRRWVSRIQAAYGALYNQLDQSFGGLYSHYISLAEGMVRDNAAADTLLADMRQSILLQPSQALHTHGRRGTEDVRQLLR